MAKKEKNALINPQSNYGKYKSEWAPLYLNGNTLPHNQNVYIHKMYIGNRNIEHLLNRRDSYFSAKILISNGSDGRCARHLSDVELKITFSLRIYIFATDTWRTINVGILQTTEAKEKKPYYPFKKGHKKGRMKYSLKL